MTRGSLIYKGQRGQSRELGLHLALVTLDSVVGEPGSEEALLIVLAPRFAATVKVSTKYVNYLYIIFQLTIQVIVLLESASFSHCHSHSELSCCRHTCKYPSANEPRGLHASSLHPIFLSLCDGSSCTRD